ncbi:hypothetical protein N8152_01095 [bacterium]|nr:hypothetical protein [bacterium]
MRDPPGRRHSPTKKRALCLKRRWLDRWSRVLTHASKDTQGNWYNA